MRRNVSPLLVLLCLVGCGSRSDAPITSGYDKQEMEAAIARARAEVDRFITELAQPTGTAHSVKAPIVDGENTEHFWLTDVTYSNGEFHGTINNEPGMVSNVKMGQQWTVKQTEISDWMFMRDGKIHGNYTLRPLLKTMSAVEAATYRSMLAEDDAAAK